MSTTNKGDEKQQKLNNFRKNVVKQGGSIFLNSKFLCKELPEVFFMKPSSKILKFLSTKVYSDIHVYSVLSHISSFCNQK